MNHFANGGHLYKSCRGMFRTTPVNVGISFVMRTYPNINETKPGLHSVKGYDQQFSRLCKGNIRVEAGITKAANIMHCTYV